MLHASLSLTCYCALIPLLPVLADMKNKYDCLVAAYDVKKKDHLIIMQMYV